MTSTDPGVESVATAVATAIDAMRSSSPLVHCITNRVVANFTANVLLAAGAAPAMVDDPEDAEVLAGVAGALLVNLGTVTRAQAAGMRAAIAAVNAASPTVPWVLDPVAIGALPLRTGLAAEFARQGPAIIRGNASEIGALAGGTGGRGVDSTASPDEVAEVAENVARSLGSVVAMSGTVDLITDGTRTVRVTAGHPLLTRVTGVGCALGSVMGALAAVTDPLTAAIAATAMVCLAGETAAGDGSTDGEVGTGTFAVRFLDALTLTPADEIAQVLRRPVPSGSAA
ncbi:hydroxyethylthiazole kinase [Nakamurella leprariae]